MSDADDDAFAGSLAGRRAPDSLDTRRAARLARYFDDHPRSEQSVHHDPVGEAQLLAYLRARQDAPQAAATTEAPRSLLTRLSEWLSPGGGPGMRYAGGAVAVLALAVGVIYVKEPLDDDGTVIKGLPAASAPASDAGRSQVVTVADPAAAALKLQSQLQALGVLAAVEPDGPDRVLRADIPAQDRAAAGPLLDAQGLVLDADGRLAVRFRRR